MRTDYAYLQLEAEILEKLDEKFWQAGERLPSIRELCRSKHLSKATVLHAYQRLEAAGRIESRPKSGYFVRHHPLHQQSGRQTTPRQAPPHPVPVNSSDVLKDIMIRGAAFDLLPPQQQASSHRETPQKGIQLLNRCLGRALRQQKGQTHLYYDQPAGHQPLREQLALRYQRDGCKLEAEHLCITSGCQHALFLALKVCCKAGDLVAVESPCFYGTLQLLEFLQLRVLEIPASSITGLNPDLLEVALQQWSIKACVITPAFATPTGALMPVPQQQKLLQLAEQHDFAVIEDDIYRELGFYQRPAPLKAADPGGRVILCGSFSKTLSRDLRLGWIQAGRWQQQLVQMKLVTQLASSRFIQQGLTEFLREGSYDQHLRTIHDSLRHNCQEWMQALARLWPDLTPSTPQGGLAIWMEWAQQLDTLALYNQAIKQGLVITPGPLFSATNQFRNALRLSFASPLTPQRQQALNKLRQLI